MTQILERWESLKNLHVVKEDNEKSWIFRKELEAQHGRFLIPFVHDLPVLTLEYRVLSTRLLRDLSPKADLPDPLQLTNYDIDHLKSALIVAELLDLIYREIIDNPGEVIRLTADRKRLRALLRIDGYQFKHKKTVNNPDALSFQVIREYTAMFNWLRLFIVRGRRFFVLLIPLIEAVKDYSKVIQSVDKYLGPVLNYIGWIFYIPRLLANLIELVVHVPGWAWMNTREKQLGWGTRLKSQMDRNGYDLGNDVAWFICGVLCCFTLVGPLAPVALLLTVGVFVFDFIMALTRGLIEGLRMRALEEKYNQRYLNATSDEERQCIRTEMDALILHTDNDRRRLYWRLANTGFILFGMALALPLLAACSPVLPFTGAALIILVTISIYLLGRWLEARTPTDRPARLPQSHRFFTPAPPSDLEDNIADEEVNYFPDNDCSSGDEGQKMLGYSF